jgi:signal transduction histidine kinase
MIEVNRPQAAIESERSRRFDRLAWSLAVAAIASAGVGVAMGIYYAVISGDTGTVLSHLSVTSFVTIVYATVGALMASRRPKNPIGWIFISVGLLYSLSALAAAYQDYASILAGGDVLPGVRLAEWLNSWVWLPALILSTVFVFLLFPDGRLLSPRWRIVFWSGVLGLVMSILAMAIHPGPLEAWDIGPNPYGVPVAEGVLDIMVSLGQLMLGISFAGAIISFVLRYRRSSGIGREQMKWLVYALGLMLMGVVVGSFMMVAWPDSPLVGELLITMTTLSVLGIAVAAGIAILRYRLYDIDLVINRTLVYGALTACVILIYVLIVGGLGALFQTRANPFLALLATGLVAVLFQPLRGRLQRGVDRLFYGQRDDPLGTLSQLGRKLETAIDPEVVLPTLVETVAQTLRLPYVAIILRTGEKFILTAQTGQEVAGVIRFPLIYQGETIGQLMAGPRGRGEPFSKTDEHLLENIAHQAGPAVHAVQLSAALQHSRLQLVTAREEERRRLRRDLHDGLGATLAALNLEAGAIRRSIRSDPEKAEALVDELKTDIRATIDDIRRLVYELRPPTLDQLGLVAAVRAQAVQCSRPAERAPGEDGESRLEVRVNAPEELPPLPAAVEVAAYRIAQEAMTNVVHHAQARHCQVRLEMDDELRVEIVDDGVGVATGRDAYGGLGLLSMRERAVELGGTCVVEPAPGGGTRVFASLPLAED